MSQNLFIGGASTNVARLADRVIRVRAIYSTAHRRQFKGRTGLSRPYSTFSRKGVNPSGRISFSRVSCSYKSGRFG